jgi:hypothetical protein
MALASVAPSPGTWDNILTTTMNNYRKSLTDNIFNSRPLLEYLMSKGRVRMLDGGYQIVEPLLLGGGEANSYGPWQQIQVNAVQGISAAVYPWRQLYATIIISGLEEAQNNGKEQIISLVEAKVMQAEETLKDLLSKMLYGTKAGALPTDWDPFTTLIDATAAAGGITPAAAPAIENLWRSPTWNAATNTGTDSKGAAIVMPGPALTSPYDGTELETVLRHMFMLSSDSGSDHVDAIFAGAAWYSAYEASLTPQVRYTDTSKANLGFQNLMFKNVPLYYDADCPTGTALGLNSKYIGLAIHSDRNFKQSPFTANLSGSVASTANANPGAAAAAPAANAIDARVSFITTFGNTTVRNRRRLFKITGATFG